MIVGIDIGGSTTDAVTVDNGDYHVVTIEANDPVAAAAGALGKLVEEYGIRLDQVACVAATGAGSRALSATLLGRPVVKVSEFTPAALDKWRAIAQATAWKDFAARNADCEHLLKLATAVAAAEPAAATEHVVRGGELRLPAAAALERAAARCAAGDVGLGREVLSACGGLAGLIAGNRPGTVGHFVWTTPMTR